ncbi:MAG: biotin/lipoyl-binding protein [Proteocatella sp.]
MKRKLKIVLAIFATVIIVALALVWMLKGENISVVEVGKPANLKEVVKETGIVLSSQNFSVTPSFDGKIEINVELGDAVKKGQVIANINPEDLQTAISQLNGQIQSVSGQKNTTGMSNPQNKEIEAQKIQLEILKRNIQKTKQDYENIKALYDSGGTAKTEVDTIYNLLKASEDELKIQETNLKVMQNNFSAMQAYFNGQLQSLESQRKSLIAKKNKAQILSPGEGVITKLNVSDGEMASMSYPIMEISSMLQTKINSEIAAEVAVDLNVGDKVEIIYETKNTSKTFDGKITKIAAFATSDISSLGLEEQKMSVETTFPNLKQIPVGYKLDVNFITIDKPGVISVPKLSVFEKEGKDYVLKIENNKIKSQEVKKGIETRNSLEILEGLSEGDRIALEPNNNKLKEGARVSY